MVKPKYLEPGIFLAAALALGAGALLALGERGRMVATTSHGTYALQHLASALLASACFCVAAAGSYLLVRRQARSLEGRPTLFFVMGIALLFCVFWLPVLLAGGFVQDDWLLLAAASVRHVIVAHPTASWMALDSVDGNFRPLGTVLYVSTMYDLFGMAPRVFLLGNFLLNLGGVMMAFLLVRELGYSKVAGAMAAMLYLSRGVLYVQAGWVSALGDCIVDFLTAAVLLLLLKAIRRGGWPVVALHCAAWGLFAVSTLAKQSAYTTPLVVAALLWLRPGPAARLPVRQRLLQVTAALAVYGGTAAVIVFHAKALLGKQTPYPASLSVFALLRSFAYVFWYFATPYAPASTLLAKSHPVVPLDVAGMLLVGLAAYLLVRYPWLMGERPRDIGFLVVAASCSILPFLVVADRNVAYYGTMLAFWVSLATAVLLSRVRSPGPARAAAFGFCALLVLGFLDVRLKQVGAVWAGGYFWGNADVASEGSRYTALQQLLALEPQGRTAVLIDPPIQPRFYASMVMLLAPRIQRILIYDSRTGRYLENDRGGLLPSDGVPALRDVNAYQWLTPVERRRAEDLAGAGETVWIGYGQDGFVAERGAPVGVAKLAGTLEGQARVTR